MIRVQRQRFDVNAEIEKLTAGNPKIGGVATFIGFVRNESQGDAVTAMTLEHYPGMTEKAIGKIVNDVVNRWSLGDVLVIHRYGRLAPGDFIMMVATAAKHRKEAFEAADFLMDYLKSRAPFWKKEVTDQSQDWVVSKAEDETALKRW